MKTYFFTLLLCFFCFQYAQSQVEANCDGTVYPKVLLAGDSWAQYMGDDATYSPIFAAYGHADKILVTETVVPDNNPYTGTAYAISGSEAREWANTETYGYIANMVQALEANPTIETVVLSIGGNDILAAKSDGGWYKDMDLDVPGSEQILFNTIEANILTIVDAAKAVRPDIEVLLTSYEYPNFNVGFFTCWVYACPKRDDLSRDPNNDLITDAELNQMMITVETQRQGTVDLEDRLFYDNSIGLMHHVYGDGNVGPGVLPPPEGTTPYAPGGNPERPALRENFRITGDPIHLDAEAYEYKMKNTMDNYFSDKFRGTPDATFFSEGGANDGWVDVVANEMGTDGIRMGDDGFFPITEHDWRGILSFNTANLPDNAIVTGASIYLNRSGAGGNSNPYDLEDRLPKLDIISGTFGNPEVELSDGTATADATDVGCFHGTVPSNYDATRIDIHPSYLQHINTSGRTQFQLYFNLADWAANYIDYYDGSQQGLTQTGDTKSAKQSPKIITKEKTIQVEQEDGTVVEELIQVMMLAHNGLSQAMGTTAPFIDISYTLPLPLALTTFDAVAKEQQSLLTWETAQEKEVLGFDIERSADAENWEKIGFKASQGDSQTRQTYRFIDALPLEGKNYYRLAFVTADEKTAYSDIEVLNFETTTFAAVYPNPFSNNLTIEFDELIEGQVNIVLTDILGRVVIERSKDFVDATWTMNLPETLGSGQYFLNIKTEQGSQVIKLVK